MIKLKELISESNIFKSDIENFEKTIVSRYNKFLEQFHIYYDVDNNSIFLSDIYIHPKFKGQGWGSKIMRELCGFADLKKLPIVLIPATDNLHPKSLRKLVNFYKKFGFIENNGNTQFDDMGMYRLPK